jgi:hypothetical protein
MNYILKFDSYKINESIEVSDSDLGKQILAYLEEYPTKYKTDADYKKKDITRAGDSNKFFFFSNKIFFKDIEKKDPKTGKKVKSKQSTGEYRIDISMVSDPKSGLHKDPYQIFISKVESSALDKKRFKNSLRDDLFGDYRPDADRVGGGKDVIDNISFSTSEKEGMKKLNIDKNLAKKIYEEVEKVWSLTNRNVKDTARGGSQNKKSTTWKWRK